MICYYLNVHFQGQRLKRDKGYVTCSGQGTDCNERTCNFDVLLTVHLDITLVNDQLDAQLF